MKTSRSGNPLLTLLIVIVLAQAVLLALVWHTVANDRAQANQQAMQQQGRIAALSGFANYNHGVVSVERGKVYLPGLHLALPLNDTTASLMYSLRAMPGSAANEADVTIQAVAAFVPDNAPIRDCSALVRIKFEAKPNPYSPSEKPAASVTLSGGRILQVYASHLDTCATEYKLTNANPDALAATFKEAALY